MGDSRLPMSFPHPPYLPLPSLVFQCSVSIFGINFSNLLGHHLPHCAQLPCTGFDPNDFCKHRERQESRQAGRLDSSFFICQYFKALHYQGFDYMCVSGSSSLFLLPCCDWGGGTLRYLLSLSFLQLVFEFMPFVSHFFGVYYYPLL